MKNTLLTIVMSLIVGGIIGFLIEKREATKIQNQCDSLKSEDCVKDLTIMRYEYMMELLSKDSACKAALINVQYETE